MNTETEIMSILTYMGWTDLEIIEFFDFATAIESGKYFFQNVRNPHPEILRQRSTLPLPGRTKRVEPAPYKLPEIVPDVKENGQGLHRISWRLKERGWGDTEYFAARILLNFINLRERELLDRWREKNRNARENKLQTELNSSDE